MPTGTDRGGAPSAVPGSPAPIVDAQVHVWLRASHRYPWAAGSLGQLPSHLVPRYTTADRSADELVGMMDEVGVSATVLTSPWLYGADHSYVFDAAQRHAGRFAVVGPYDLPARDLGSTLSAFRQRPHALGPRIFLGSPGPDGAATPRHAVDELLAAARAQDLPVFVSPMGRLDELARAARSVPDVTLVVDHAGLWLPGSVEQRWELLPKVLELAAFPNVLVKCTALPELSGTPYPYPDLWRILHPLLDRFGPDRLMWGSDINQHRDALSYAQSLDYIRDSSELSDEDRTQVLGGTAARLLAARSLVGASIRPGREV